MASSSSSPVFKTHPEVLNGCKSTLALAACRHLTVWSGLGLDDSHECQDKEKLILYASSLPGENGEVRSKPVSLSCLERGFDSIIGIDFPTPSIAKDVGEGRNSSAEFDTWMDGILHPLDTSIEGALHQLCILIPFKLTLRVQYLVSGTR